MSAEAVAAPDTATAPCRYLEWDSTFFGHRIARVTNSRLNPERAADVERWCATHRIACVYLLADPEDLATVRTAADCGFRVVDVRVTLAVDQPATLRTLEPDALVRVWIPTDVPSLRAIARRSHRGTRFYTDGRFDQARCDELYAEWIERSCRGDADAVFVVEHDDQVAGYLSCHLREPKVGQIGLVAVAEAAQGRGLGPRMLNHALSWFADQGVRVVNVVTQGSNTFALRYYQRRGFAVESVGLSYHRWFEPSAPDAAL